jgi:hypothetical protein
MIWKYGMSICKKTTTLIFLDLELVHHFIDRNLWYNLSTSSKPIYFYLPLVTSSLLCMVQVQIILRPTVSRPVRLSGMPLSEQVTRSYISLSDKYFPSFSYRRTLWREDGSIICYAMTQVEVQVILRPTVSRPVFLCFTISFFFL